MKINFYVPKKVMVIAALILLAVLYVACVPATPPVPAGSASTTNESWKLKGEGALTLVSQQKLLQGDDPYGYNVLVFQDTVTGARYLFADGNWKVTPLGSGLR